MHQGSHQHNIVAQPLYHPNLNWEREKKDQDPNPKRRREDCRQDPSHVKAHSTMDAKEIITSRAKVYYKKKRKLTYLSTTPTLTGRSIL